MEGNTGPDWSFEHLTPFTRLGVPRELPVPQRPEPSQANRRESSSQPNNFAASGHRARTPEAAMRIRYPVSREATAQPRDRPTSAGATHHSLGGRHLPRPEHTVQDMASGQIQRFEGDGFDMRRPIGWRGQAEGQGSAEGQHLVEISDGEDDEPILLDEDRDGITAYRAHSVPDEHDAEEVVDLTEDDYPLQNGETRNDRPLQHEIRPRLQPPDAARPSNNGTPRLPRGMAGIINLDNGEEAWTVDDEPVILEPSSPDIQFVSARRLDPPRRNDSDGDEVQFVRAQPLSEYERLIREHAAQQAELDRVIAVLGRHRHQHSHFRHLREEIDRANAHIHRAQAAMHRPGPVPPPRLRRAGHIRMGVAGAGPGMFIAPNLNFGEVGFDLGLAQAEPPPPTYEAPAPAPEGFTRSPEESDALVCPNCDEELCKGDDEVKKQVWIAKQCGHVSSLSHSSCSSRVNMLGRSTVANAQQIDRSSAAQRAKKSKQPQNKPFQGMCCRGLWQEGFELEGHVPDLHFVVGRGVAGQLVSTSVALLRPIEGYIGSSGAFNFSS